MTRSRATAQDVAYWLMPPLLCLIVHWYGFTAWFRDDDFAWLGLANSVHTFRELLSALFSPQAQGTIRPWSERGFFMAGYSLFGLNALPYRILIFATQFASLALVASIGTRLTGRRAAGFFAAVFWAVSATGVQPLSWACVYNEVLCSLFLLLAFHFLLRYIETGVVRYYIYQWIVFLLGFGALEVNLVYPALAVAYAFFCARRYLLKTLALVPVSILYVAIHTALAPMPKTGVYGMHFDLSLFKTLLTYWTWTVGPSYLAVPFHVRRATILAAIAAISLALAGFAFQKLRQGNPVGLFCLLWFPILLAPVLPLRDHLTEYYPYLSAIGLCWLAGWAAVEAWRGSPALRALVATLALLYFALVIPRTVSASRSQRDACNRARNLVEGVAAASQAHPGKTLLLHGVNTELFSNVVHAYAFRLVGVNHVYLTPGSERQIATRPDSDNPLDFVLSGSVTSRALDRDRLEVYDVRGPLLRNITSAYAAQPRDLSLPAAVYPGNPLMDGLLGPEWYSIDSDHRWMPRRATLRLAAPTRAGQQLHLLGNCTDQQLQSGPLSVTVNVNGATLPAAPIAAAAFDLAFPLPDSLIGQPEIQLAIEVSRTIRPPSDPRELGLAFGEIAVR